MVLGSHPMRMDTLVNTLWKRWPTASVSELDSSYLFIFKAPGKKFYPVIFEENRSQLKRFSFFEGQKHSIEVFFYPPSFMLVAFCMIPSDYITIFPFNCQIYFKEHKRRLVFYIYLGMYHFCSSFILNILKFF